MLFWFRGKFVIGLWVTYVHQVMKNIIKKINHMHLCRLDEDSSHFGDWLWESIVHCTIGNKIFTCERWMRKKSVLGSSVKSIGDYSIHEKQSQARKNSEQDTCCPLDPCMVEPWSSRTFYLPFCSFLLLLLCYGLLLPHFVDPCFLVNTHLCATLFSGPKSHQWPTFLAQVHSLSSSSHPFT